MVSIPRSDWSDPGWQQAAHTWIRNRLVELGFRGDGGIEPYHTRPWSVVLRVETGSGPLWFKSNTPDGVFEATLTVALGAWTPGSVVAPLVIEPDLGWMLNPDGGPTMRETMAGTPDLARWEAMLGAYAQLQRELTRRAEDLMALGVPDLRLPWMPGELSALLDNAAVHQGLGAEKHAAVAALLPAYEQWCTELEADGVPATLQHDDLHDGNVFVTGDGHRFFDWADASVTHPFGSLLVALSVAQMQFKLPAGAPELARLRDAYLEPWTGTNDRATLARSATLAMRVAKVGRSLSWERALRGATLPVEPDHATAPVEWLGELTEPDLV